MADYFGYCYECEHYRLARKKELQQVCSLCEEPFEDIIDFHEKDLVNFALDFFNPILKKDGNNEL